MAQPTLTGVTLNAGTGGEDLLVDVVSSKLAQVILVGYSTGDGTLNVVMADAGLPVQLETGHADLKITLDGESVTAVGAAAENAAVSGNPVLVAGRYDLGTRTLGDGDVGTLAVNSNGVLFVTLFGTNNVQITNNTLAVVGAETENYAVAQDPLLIAGRYDSSPRTLDSGDAGALALTTNGYLIATNAGTFAVQVDGNALTALQLIDDPVATTGSAIPAKGFAVSGTDGTNARVLKTDSGGELQIDVLTITAGDNNIGNVDIVTLPSGNLGMQAMAASLSVVPASDITDGTYIGDIKFGEGLLANSGVDIGDVDVTSVVPGTAATNLGKAIDSVVGATDTGVALLGKHAGDVTHTTTADGDYDVVRTSDLGALHTSPEQHHTFDLMDATTGWAALSNDTLNLATTTKHVLGTAALTFDKVNGAANTVFGAIAKTISSVDLGDISPHDIIQANCYLPTITDVDYIFIRLGTDSSNYNEWRVADTELTAAEFETLALSVGDASYSGITGNGWNPSAITYVAVGVAFNAESNALAGIIFDEVSFHTNQHTSAMLNAEVSSSVSSANVNLQKVGGSATDKGSGNASNGSQRIVVATDDVNLAAVKTAVELVDDTVAVLGTATYAEATTKGNVVGAVRNDDKATLGNTDNELVPLQVDNEGALYVNQAAAELKSDSGVAVGGAPGTDDMIAAVPGKKLKVVAFSLMATSTTTNNVFVDNVDNDLYGNSGNPIPLSMDADADTIPGFVKDYNPAGWFKTDAVNEAVTLNSSAAQDIIWSISWIETD